MTNRLALRIGVFGGVALALFVVLFFRLWTLQVVNGEEYLAEANNNRTREYRVAPPRGDDPRPRRRGTGRQPDQPCSAGQPAQTGRRRAPAARGAGRLADLTGTTLRRLRRTMHEELDAGAQRPGDAAQRRRPLPRLLPAGEPGPFPGGRGARVFVRDYPHGTLAAHLFGTVGEVSEEQLKEPRHSGLEPGDIVGQGRRRVPVRPGAARPRRGDPDPGRLAGPADAGRTAEGGRADSR